MTADHGGPLSVGLTVLTTIQLYPTELSVRIATGVGTPMSMTFFSCPHCHYNFKGTVCRICPRCGARFSSSSYEEARETQFGEGLGGFIVALFAIAGTISAAFLPGTLGYPSWTPYVSVPVVWIVTVMLWRWFYSLSRAGVGPHRQRTSAR